MNPSATNKSILSAAINPTNTIVGSHQHHRRLVGSPRSLPPSPSVDIATDRHRHEPTLPSTSLPTTSPSLPTTSPSRRNRSRSTNNHHLPTTNNLRFVTSKFEDIFHKYARTNSDALTSEELDKFIKGNREPKDYGGCNM
ncbi:hypothetical protein L6452_02639 [Arctium lappa]|uniref:Uncharacterized protein n=1 Tax=Arctium lappa TaxID=4217 RepID=A0ACB9FJH6_ARCLA|nr:hypothetical protein L6452_02639 [Arctium lappa]